MIVIISWVFVTLSFTFLVGHHFWNWGMQWKIQYLHEKRRRLRAEHYSTIWRRKAFELAGMDYDAIVADDDEDDEIVGVN